MTDAKPGLTDEELEQYRGIGECQGLLARIDADRKRIAALEDQAADDRTWLVERNKARAERDTLRRKNKIMRDFLEQLSPDVRHSDVTAFLEGN